MAILANPYVGDDEPPDEHDPMRDDQPTDLEEAEAIGCGASLLLAERRHVVALMTELQRVREERDTARLTRKTVLEALDAHLRAYAGAYIVRPREEQS